MHLYVSKAGGKLWRYRYMFADKEKLLSLGSYPDMSLLDARAARDKAKADLKKGRDPSVTKKIERLTVSQEAGDTFELIARQWFALQKSQWVARHAEKVIESLELHVFPSLGSLPIREITASQVLSVLRTIEARPAIDTARRVRQRMSAVFVYAIASGRAKDDPAAIVQGAMAPLKKSRQPAITDLNQAREILQKVDNEAAHPVTKLAMRLLALTAVRPGTLITTPWTEFANVSEQNPVWQIPAQRMKLRLAHKEDEARDHLVPLAKQALETIETLRQITGKGPLVFPNTRHAHKPMSENALGYLLNRAGYHHRHVPHGWRSTFSTEMNERYPEYKDVIDFMLAHIPKDKVEAAYNRALYLPKRKELAQIWADLILKDTKRPAELLTGMRHN
ncbi:tyrosine-type recombinase/integrase [Phyllobacterium zundukense]|uniref:tyrosine-type recombinase/integrase n=1 Tax=Phyllobacterium zundukense TaxID=1867719 RepID=UPI00290572EA|nr:integrase arm-type DNA-binding domain-containing protein [Phyllobacterium zundukense]